MDKIKILSFKSEEELKNCKALQEMGRYEWKKVLLDGKPVYACTTNQQYEDILWGGIEMVLREFESHFHILESPENHVDKEELSSELRDMILEKYEKYGIKLVDVFDEY